ncbi:MAG TPA: phage tail sheath C-terminal domain-containing protein [Polyangia bacterium]|nr:phage tail sheath C-terminal domain-containing protein [Polyangia bacterium]
MAWRTDLGAPGVYFGTPAPVRELSGVRLDVCAFVGVAPRGPARLPLYRADWLPDPDAPDLSDFRAPAGRTSLPSLPVAVTSWPEYRNRFGTFEGPSLLPYAVAAFFENGGRRAYVIRTVPDPDTAPAAAPGVARATLSGLHRAGTTLPVGLRARDEGSWGNGLRLTLESRVRPVLLDVRAGQRGEVVLAGDAALPAGALLRFSLGAGAWFSTALSAVRREWHPAEARTLQIGTLEAALPAVAPFLGGVQGFVAEEITGVVTIDDAGGPGERHEDVAFSAAHPRWLARVLCEESRLVLPDERPGQEWHEGRLDPAAGLAPGEAVFTGGADRYADVVPADHFDPRWVTGDEASGRGLHALAEIEDVGTVVVPDLYSPGPLVVEDRTVEAPRGGSSFERCLAQTALPQAAPNEMAGLRLDPELPDEREKIIKLQERVVEFVAGLRAPIALLDVPPRLTDRQILSWRRRFDSAYSAAYHPWLRAARRDDGRGPTVAVNPAAVAAGIIAREELRAGVPQGPANVLAAGIVATAEKVTDARHDELHRSSINVFRSERDGVRLTAARTLSADPRYRQLSVRRLVTVVCKTLEQQMQWAVFEPNGPQLRATLRHMIDAFLRQLYRADAFTGASEDEAYFVRCDEDNNPAAWRDTGRLLAEIGIAPAEPLEFIVVTLAREGDGTLRVEG